MTPPSVHLFRTAEGNCWAFAEWARPYAPELDALLRDLPAAAMPVAVVRRAEFNGKIISVCHSARSLTIGAEAGVETLSEARGRGFGAAAVATWSAAVQAAGRLAFYSTTWENTASRRIAARLGFECYGEDMHLGLRRSS